MKRLIPLLFLALALSACTVRLDANLVVNEDESGSFAIFLGLDDELAALVEQFAPDLNLADQLGGIEGWTTEEVSQDVFNGVEVSSDFSSFDDLESKLLAFDDAGAEGFGAGALSRFQLEREGDEFRFNANIAGLTSELGSAFEGSEFEEFATGFGGGDLSQLFEAEFRLTLPGSIGENNADTVSGDTLTWELSFSDDAEALSATSTLGGSSSALIVGGGAVLLVAAVGGGVVAARRRKGKAELRAVERAGL